MASPLIRGFRWQGQEFHFELCRKREVQLGPVVVDQWWMPVPPLYGQRRGALPPPHNHTEILRVYWAIAEGTGANQSRNAQERCLLASLVPRVRAEGSRTIFADAFLKPGAHRRVSGTVQNLESLLAAGCQSALSRADFHSRSWDVLGHPAYPAGVEQHYQQFTEELLETPCRLLGAGDHEPARKLVEKTWNRWMTSIARRAGRVTEKLALDILSYEARSAFHHCYSLVWCDLLSWLGRLEKFTETTGIFLKFWHTDWIDSETNMSLFHGHVFGLHPGTGPFMLTETGKRLVGEWLAEPLEVQRLQRLLHGILIGLFDYAGRREGAAADRLRSVVQTVPDLEAVEEMQVKRRQGKRSR